MFLCIIFEHEARMNELSIDGFQPPLITEHQFDAVRVHLQFNGRIDTHS